MKSKSERLIWTKNQSEKMQMFHDNVITYPLRNEKLIINRCGGRRRFPTPTLTSIVKVISPSMS